MRTFNPDTDTITPQAWIGCLACYNDGQLVGHWYDAVDAGEVLPVDLHGVPTGHEELWVMDHEHLPTIPGSPEMDPHTAVQWGRAIEAISPHWRPAYIAWIEDQWIKDPEDAPSRDDFFDFFAGEYSDFEAYADEIVRDTGMLIGVSDDVASYFDLSRYARDLAMDYTTIDTPDYGVWIYRNH
ncbi:MAG: antirestriction protein ArdA [Corynebacterium sp.]|uniref:antirestriction protein ArdA n=1 Tax=Corynebacterium sp. TaxID=1720 RepID=UPI003F0FCA8B